jgi:hypothetical protein
VRFSRSTPVICGIAGMRLLPVLTIFGSEPLSSVTRLAVVLVDEQPGQHTGTTAAAAAGIFAGADQPEDPPVVVGDDVDGSGAGFGGGAAE